MEEGQRYDRIGVGYCKYRHPDQRIAAAIAGALGDAELVVNVGAGTGSYEPQDRRVVAVEPSAEMIRQRAEGTAPVVQASAEKLPFGDESHDAALAVLTVHLWRDRQTGLREMRRVARKVVVFTWDPEHEGFWLVRDYFPDLLALDRAIFPTMSELEGVLGELSVTRVPIARDCTDGFLGAYWARPEAYLDPGARGAISSFTRIGGVEERIERLRADLSRGEWARRNEELQSLQELDVGYRLVVTGEMPRVATAG